MYEKIIRCRNKNDYWILMNYLTDQTDYLWAGRSKPNEKDLYEGSGTKDEDFMNIFLNKEDELKYLTYSTVEKVFDQENLLVRFEEFFKLPLIKREHLKDVKKLLKLNKLNLYDLTEEMKNKLDEKNLSDWYYKI